MKFHESPDGVHYLTFDSLPTNRVIHGFFTRKGGVSPEPWASLNTGGTVGDERAHVIENRRRIFSALGRRVESVFDVWQVHGVEARASRQPRPLDAPHEQADIILTDSPEVTLFMRFADCVPIFLYDPIRHAAGLAHAGWQGTVKKAAAAAVAAMVLHYGCKPADLTAVIGPSIGPDHYAVGEDVIRQVQSAFGERADQLLASVDGKIHLDLWEANRLTLAESGVGQIETSRVCTACDVSLWFSHRAENGRTGRLGAILALAD